MRVGVGPTGMLVACSDLSGPYRSLDRGQSWLPPGPDRGITHTHAASVAFHATNPALLYVGSGGGLFRSRDYGESFDEVITNGYFEHVAIAPANELIAYAAFHFTNTLGLFDANGAAAATFHAPPLVLSLVVGEQISAAYAALSPQPFASPAWSVLIVP